MNSLPSVDIVQDTLHRAMEAIRNARRVEKWQLEGKVAVVTGGSRGLGYLLARDLGRAGCSVAICARDVGELEEARQRLLADGARQVLTVPCDLMDRAQVERLIAETTRHFGRVDILVNNAGIIQVGPIDNMSVTDFEAAMGVMFWGMVYATLAVLPQMRARRSGRIVNITSIGGKVSVPHLLPYGAAKFAAVGFSEGLRAELTGSGVAVVTIVPGLMRTGSHLNALFKGRQEREFIWFSLGASLPLLSMDAERAAQQIVNAARRGQSEQILSMPAAVLARVHGLFPGLTAQLLGIANAVVLPPPGEGTAAMRGQEVNRRLRSSLLNVATALGLSAARRFLQH